MSSPFQLSTAALISAMTVGSLTADVFGGQWNAKFADSEEFARANNVPMVLFVGAVDCDSCNAVSDMLDTDSRFLAWRQERSKIVYAYVKGDSKNNIAVYLSNPKKYKDAVSEDLAAALQFTSGSVIPRVALYWPKKSGEVLKETYSCWDKYMPVKEPKGDVIGQLLACMNRFFADYSERSVTAFVMDTTPANRLETSPGVTQLTVPVARTSGLAMTNDTWLVVGDGLSTVRIPWTKDQDRAYVEIAFDPLTEGETLPLTLLGDDGKEQARSFVTCVGEVENNPKNPLWLGERDVTSLKPGEWTMDRDLALAKAAASGGSTLTLIGGSLWCPDCVNADAYLVDTDLFKEWAANRNVYCAAIDVPAFPKGATTCLLTYDPTTVSDRYVNATVPPQERVQSGAGYLSRKMIPMTGNGGMNATEILARNLNLTTNSVESGGLCRPEHLDAANTETGSWKTGVPCFVLQNAAGKISGRLYQFSNVSPTNDAAAAAYVQRLDELRRLADDPTEEVNKHWSTAGTADCALDARNGSVTSTISAIDNSDCWRLVNRARWTRMTFSVKGASGATDETDARLVLWRKSGAAAVKVAQAEGNLATGFSLDSQEVSADASLDYFVQLEALATSAAFALEREGDSTVTYVLSVSAADDAGELAFANGGESVNEADVKKAGGIVSVYAPIARTGGASGETNVAIVVDAATTAFADRYELVTDFLAWNDGETGQKSVRILVFDDPNADGTQSLVLRAGASTWTLTIIDNDKMNVGKLSFARTVPALAKKGMVIAEEGSLVTNFVSRVDGASGDVGCTVNTTAGDFESATELAWRSRESGERPVVLRLPMLADCAAGKAVLSLDRLTGGVKADSQTKTVTVKIVASGCPRFETDEKSFALARYCSVSQEVRIVSVEDGASVKVSKISGSVPSGLKVKAVGSVLQITGTPSGKGRFEAVYQVSQVLNRKTTDGLSVRLVFTVADVGKLDPSDPGANPAVAKSRTFGDQMVVDVSARRLTGVLSNLTLPPTGKCSAKYKCAAGTISLSSKGWNDYDPASGALRARLTTSKGAYAVEVSAVRSGEVRFVLEDPSFAEGALVGEVADSWSADGPATPWLGYYTAAVVNPDMNGAVGEVLAVGNPYLTLKMQTATLAKKGLMSYAGCLPNGQSFSGSGTLVRDVLGTVVLPVCYRTNRDFFTLAPQIKAYAPAKAVECGGDILPWWTHAESSCDISHEVRYTGIVGSWYDAKLDLLTTLNPTANGHELTAAGAIAPVSADISSKTVKLDAASAKASSAKLSFSKSTGLVSGSFKVEKSDGSRATANYKGVLLPDWGDGCSICGEVTWATGAFWFSDRISANDGARSRTVNVKRGDAFHIEHN